MGFSISDPEADTIKFGEAIVFVSAILLLETPCSSVGLCVTFFTNHLTHTLTNLMSECTC